jgi:hypothetical protein
LNDRFGASVRSDARSPWTEVFTYALHGPHSRRAAGRDAFSPS